MCLSVLSLTRFARENRVNQFAFIHKCMYKLSEKSIFIWQSYDNLRLRNINKSIHRTVNRAPRIDTKSQTRFSNTVYFNAWDFARARRLKIRNINCEHRIRLSITITCHVKINSKLILTDYCILSYYYFLKLRISFYLSSLSLTYFIARCTLLRL